MASPPEPRITLIDHTTGEIAELESRRVEELASTLIEQARSMHPAAVGTPPSDEHDE
jgi:hypothetical protein